MAGGPVKVGVVGCGHISGVYFQVMKTFEILDVVACADLDPARAREKAAAYGVPRACSIEELLADPKIELVLNLTVPKAHAAVSLAAIEAGKSIYSEKPLATDRESCRRVLEAARERGVRVGCAPDTFLGGGLQTCRKALDDGLVGAPVAATATFMSHGTEFWHPDPDFFYQPGAGPLFDMGPYYLTALISMLGPVRRVTASARISFPERTITSEPKYGQTITVTTPTHLTGALEFAAGPIATLVTSFDVWRTGLPPLEIYGTAGSMRLPDPNRFDGAVLVRGSELREWEWRDVPLSHGYTDNTRGLGVADLAQALRSGRPHRASGELAYHVVDVMQSLLESAETGRHVELESTCDRPAPLPVGLAPGTVDD